MVMYHGLDAPSQAITPSHLFACWVKQFETVDETNTLSSLDRLVKQNSSDLHPCSVGNLQHIGGSHPACLPAMRRPRRVGGAVTTYFVRLHGPKKGGHIPAYGGAENPLVSAQLQLQVGKPVGDGSIKKNISSHLDE